MGKHLSLLSDWWQDLIAAIHHQGPGWCFRRLGRQRRRKMKWQAFEHANMVQAETLCWRTAACQAFEVHVTVPYSSSSWSLHNNLQTQRGCGSIHGKTKSGILTSWRRKSWTSFGCITFSLRGNASDLFALSKRTGKKGPEKEWKKFPFNVLLTIF